jgi:hypothetical protein
MASNSPDWERELFESDGELSRDVIAPALNNSLWKVLLNFLSFKLIGFRT